MATKKSKNDTSTRQASKIQKSTTQEDESLEKTKKWATIAAVGGGVIIIILLILFALPADTFKKDDMSPTPKPPAQEVIESTTWKLVTYLQNGQEAPIPESSEVTLVIDGDQFGGVSTCNNYFGSFEIDGDQVAVSPVGSTRKACIDEVLMTFENEYLTTLQSVTSFTTYEDTGLTLYSGTEPKTALSYEKVVE